MYTLQDVFEFSERDLNLFISSWRRNESIYIKRWLAVVFLHDHDYFSSEDMTLIQSKNAYNAFQGSNNIKEFKDRLEELNYIGIRKSKLCIANFGIEKYLNLLVLDNTVTTLDLSNSQLDKSMIQLLADVILYNTKITILDLSRNEMRDNFLLLVESLRLNATIKSLNLNTNYIGAGHVDGLASIIENNITLTELFLRYNIIHSEDLKVLSPALQKNKTLRVLSLSDNELEGADVLAPIIQQNKGLIDLRLYRNNFNDEAIRIITTALESNTTLFELELWDEGYTPYYKDKVKFLLNRNKHILAQSHELQRQHTLLIPQLKMYLPKSSVGVPTDTVEDLTDFMKTVKF